MVRVKDIYNLINAIAPFDTAMPWDNVGMLIGDFEAEVTGCLLSLDCTVEAIRLAREKGANLIVTHHPVIFDPLKTVLNDSVAFVLIKEGISVISAHTNLDLSSNGVNKALCDKIGLLKLHAFENPDSLGFTGELEAKLSCADFAKTLKHRLACDSVSYVDCDKPIKTVAVVSGSGEDYLFDSSVADAYVTGEASHHIYCYAQNAGIQLFTVGHYHSEAVVLEALKEYLASRLFESDFFVFDAPPYKMI